MYKSFSSLEELFAHLEADKNWTGAEAGLHNRYPIRFVLFDQIVEMRKEKRNSLRTFEKLESACMAEMSMPCPCFDMDERSCMPEIGSRVVRMFKELIGM